MIYRWFERSARKGILQAYRKMVAELLRCGVLPRYGWLRLVNRRLISLLTPRLVHLEGHTIYLDPVDSLGLSVKPAYEAFAVKLVRRLVRFNDVVLDVGANIGYFTLVLAESAGGSGKVFAFEADVENCRILRKNLAVNGYDRVTVESKAVSDRDGKANLYLSLRSCGHHSLFGADQEGGSVAVETVSLDSYFPAGSRVDFVKMDIEGAEMSALEGMRRVLSDNAQLMLLSEFNPVALGRAATSPSAYLDLLITQGFMLHRVDEKTQWLVPTTKETLLQEYTVENGRFTNLLCARGPLHLA
jgi:FkbM family methyltransferase